MIHCFFFYICCIFRLSFESVTHYSLFLGTSPGGVDTQTTTYNTVQTYTITVTVTSPMETVVQTKQIVCQEKITRDLAITSDHPRDFTASGRLKLLFSPYKETFI